MPSAIFSACWATLMTSEHLLPGLVVFADSLLRVHASRYPLVVMVTPNLSARALAILARIRNVVVRPVEPIYPPTKGTHLATERFHEVWTKLRAWQLEEYDRVVLVDSDMLVRRNMDELLQHPDVFGSEDRDVIASALACTCNPAKVPTYPKEWTPENCGYTPQAHPQSLLSPPPMTASSLATHRLINSGLVVLRPSTATLEAMLVCIATDARIALYRFPDQDFLAEFFYDRIRTLPWCYNALKKLRIVHPNVWRDEEAVNVHYILDKPWKLGRPGMPRNPEDPDALTHSWWWDAFDRLRLPKNHNAPDASFAIDTKDWKEVVEKYVALD
ncbi:hypothetical protein ACQY0O_006669 [Thecaphora frezii]